MEFKDQLSGGLPVEVIRVLGAPRRGLRLTTIALVSLRRGRLGMAGGYYTPSQRDKGITTLIRACFTLSCSLGARLKIWYWVKSSIV